MDRLKPAELVRLSSEAAIFSTSTHVRYLSEALQATRTSGNPCEALALLRAMWGTAYAKTRAEKESLNDIGSWLERRLHREPDANASRIALELSWARRIARIAEARMTEERPSQALRHGGSRERHARGWPSAQVQDKLSFGKNIPDILRRRIELLAKRLSASTTTTAPPLSVPPVTPEPVPTEFPPVFEARFVNFAEAHDAFRAAKKREKLGKLPRERFLLVQPVNGRLRTLAAGLVCSTRLEGFNALFNAISARGGAERTFFVRGVEKTQGKSVACEILLSNPTTEA